MPQRNSYWFKRPIKKKERRGRGSALGNLCKIFLLNVSNVLVCISCIWCDPYLNVMKSVLIWDCFGMPRYASNNYKPRQIFLYAFHAFDRTNIWNSWSLYSSEIVLVCVGWVCVGMRQNIISQGKSNKGILGVHIP